MNDQVKREFGSLEFSPSFTKLAVALVAAQPELIFPKKDAENPHFRSKYAALDSCIDENRAILARHGLAVIQPPTGDGNQVKITTILLHSSGEWLMSTFSATAKAADPQAVGSGITYLRRYAYLAVLGIAPTDDDDGNGASQPRKDPPPPPPRQAPAPKAPQEPNPPSIYDGANPDAKTWLKFMLRSKNVPTTLWANVAMKMQGCIPTHLNTAIDAAKAELNDPWGTPE